MDSSRTRLRVAFMIVVPLAWAVLLAFHPNPSHHIYDGLREEVTVWLVVHVGMLVFIGLTGVVLYQLVRPLRGSAARVCRLAIGPFVLFYGAGEAILGIAVGVLVDHANTVPEGDRAVVAGSIQQLWDSFVAGDLLISVGSVAWVIAVVAAAVAFRQAHAPVLVSVLLVLSVIVVLHPPPFGPLGLVFLAGAIGLQAFGRRATPAAAPARADLG